MKILFDTNIVLDVLLDREPFSTPAALIFSQVEEGTIEGFLCATTITTIHYLICKATGKKKAAEEIGKILKIFKIAPVNHAVLEAALKLKFSDFEDAVIHEATRQVSAKGIITRNLRDYKKAQIPVYAPQDFLYILKSVS